MTRGADTGILLSLVLLEPQSGFPLPGAGSQQDVPGRAAAQPPLWVCQGRVVAREGVGAAAERSHSTHGIGKALWVAGDTRPWEVPGCSCLPKRFVGV